MGAPKPGSGSLPAAGNGWTVPRETIPERGLDLDLVLGADRRADFARRLEVIACEAVVLSARLTRASNNSVHLAGRVTADLIQRCVVTLEPIAIRLDELVEAEFREDPLGAAAGEPDNQERDISSLIDLEPIEHGALDLDRLVFETISAALDPNPRKPGATFAWQDPSATLPASPFAVLAKLKRKE